MKSELESLRRQLAELEESKRRGVVQRDAFDEAKRTLEGRIVAAVMADGSGDASVSRWPRWILLAGVLTTLGVATAGALWLGSTSRMESRSAMPAAMSDVQPAPRSAGNEAGGAHSASSEQLAAMLDKLAARLKQNPDDADGWAMLARSYAVTGQHADAVPAFKRAAALRKDDPVLLADYADALAMTQGRAFDGEPLALVQRALKLDPGNVKALSLAGSAAFDRKDYAGALKYWESAIRVAPADSPFVPLAQDGIAQVRARSR